MSRLADCYRLLKRRLYVSGTTERAIIDDFHRLYHQTGRITGSWGVTWRGRPVAQNPMDLMAIAGIISKQTKPCEILEIGTGEGGSAEFYRDAGAHVVLTVDLKAPTKFLEAAEMLIGDSRDLRIMDSIQWRFKNGASLVILDGDHHRQTVLFELERYSPLVRLDGYLIVCDTHFNGHPIAPEFGPGPWEAVEVFLATHTDFVRDRDVEPLLTFNPGGYLRRVK